ASFAAFLRLWCAATAVTCGWSPRPDKPHFTGGRDARHIRPGGSVPRGKRDTITETGPHTRLGRRRKGAQKTCFGAARHSPEGWLFPDRGCNILLTRSLLLSRTRNRRASFGPNPSLPGSTS